MQPWNQWGVQATTGYTLPGYPAAMASPVVTAASSVSSMPYSMGGYQWPNYSATNVTPAVGGAWPVQNQQQQWDQWTQWQQQYAQWQQEYGDKYIQSVQQSTQASSTAASTVPTTAPSTTAIALPGDKRASDSTTAPDAKKAKGDENTVEAIKESLKEMAESEKQFDEQFNNWETQFNSWREQNANHPDTEQYKAYEAKWKSWRNQLLQRREQMKKKREAKMAELAKLEQDPSATSSLTVPGGVFPSMAVPPPTLGATSVATASVTPAVTPAVLPSTAVPPPGIPPPVATPDGYTTMYNPTSFYNQQGGYMFGSGTAYGVPPVFSSVPPPAVPPVNTGALPPTNAPPPIIPSTTAAPPPGPGMGTQSAQSKPSDTPTSQNNVAVSSGTSNPPSDSHSSSNFNQPPPTSGAQSTVPNVSQSSSESVGIPGLDLINQPASTQSSKPPDFNPSSTSNLIPKQQEIIQTPADSKPFDFPSPAKNQNTSVPPPSMMNFPPPGYLNPSFQVFPMGTNPNPGLLPSKHNPNKELVEALMNTVQTTPGQDNRMGNKNFNNRNQRPDFDSKNNSFSNIPPPSGPSPSNQGGSNLHPPGSYPDNNHWGPSNKAPLLPTPNMQGFNASGGKQGDMNMGGNNGPFNQGGGYKGNDGPPGSGFHNEGPGPHYGGPQGFRGNDGPNFKGNDGQHPGFRSDGPPPNFRNDGPPPNFRNDGPPPNFRNDGPPHNFRNDGPPPNYRNDGPPPNFRNDGPPNFRGNDGGFRQNGPHPGYRGNDSFRGHDGHQGFRDGGPPSGFRDGPPGFRGENFRPNGGNVWDKSRKDFDRSHHMNEDSRGFGSDYNQGFGDEDYNRNEEGDEFNENLSDKNSNDYNESYDNSHDDRGPRNQRDFKFPSSRSGSQDRNSFKDGNGPGDNSFGRSGFRRQGGGPPPLMGSGPGGPPPLMSCRPGVPMGGGPPPLMGSSPVGPMGAGPPPLMSGITPLHSPDKIIDYCHKLSNLGVPSFYEPVTMIDYAHGAHKLPEGEEDRFPPGENRDLFPKDDDFDGRIQGHIGRGPSPFRPRSDGRRGPSGRVRESRWERDPHGSSPRRDGSRSRDREERGRDDRRDRDRDTRDDRHDRDRRDDRDRDSRRDSRRDDRRDDRRGDDRRDERRDDRRGDDRRDREDKRDDRGDNKEERWRHDRSSRHDDDRHKEDRSSDRSKDSRRSSLTKTRSPTPSSKHHVEDSSMKITSEMVVTDDTRNPILLVDDLLLVPGRDRRPPRIVVILRGPPGSGKTFVAKLMKDKEVEMGGSAPRILSLDDYFMVETEKEEVDVESGRTTIVKTMEYEYESGMEPHYRESLVKAFRKTIIDGYFPFIIVDCINDKLNHFDELSTFAKQKSFQVFICEMDLDVPLCVKRNIHKRSEEEITNIVKNWEKIPVTETILDVRSLLQSASITEVNMEDSETIEDSIENVTMEHEKENDLENKINENNGKDEHMSVEDDYRDEKESKNNESEEVQNKGLLASALSSKWDDLDSSFNKLDRLDGLSKARRATSIKDWLQLPEDYFETSESSAISGKKRVRWADLEERREQEKMRAIGFVVGQTDWSRMLDPSGGESKLTQTKYI